eukprot:4898639-Pyramimonas_sp.AAC.1
MFCDTFEQDRLIHHHPVVADDAVVDAALGPDGVGWPRLPRPRTTASNTGDTGREPDVKPTESFVKSWTPQ